MGLVIRISRAYFKIQSDRRVDAPPTHLLFSRGASDRNFEMAICCCRKLEKNSFDWKLKGLVTL